MDCIVKESWKNIMDKIEAYLAQVDEQRQEAFKKLFEVVAKHIPTGFALDFQYGMIAFVVPLETYPDGYLQRKDEPVPFISLACQKKHVALYHMGLMGNPELLAWFQEEYAKQVPTKLNMGKSCIRFTNVKHIPYELIGDLVEKISVEEWLKAYETVTLKK